MSALDAAGSRHRVASSYDWLVWLAAAWFTANCAYVYFVLDGRRTYRIESAAFLFAAVALPAIFTRRSDDSVHKAPLGFAKNVLLAIACALWLAGLVPLIAYPFVSDDYVFLELYDSYRQIWHSPGFFRPGFAAVFLTLERIGGGSPVPFHLLGFLLHFTSACLVYSLVHRIHRAHGVGVVAFAVFLLNPLQLEAVLWVSGLQEALWTTLVLAALRCYTGPTGITARRLLGTLAFVWAALLTKETAVCFVLLLPLADRVSFGKRGRLQMWASVAFALTLAAYLALREVFVSFDETFLVSPSRYFLKQFLAVPYRVFSQPWNTAVVDPPAAVSFLTAVLPILLLCVTMVRRAASRLLLIGPVVILVSTLPVYSYFYVGADLISARYVYFAAAGWGVFVAHLLAATSSRPLIFSSAFVALAIALTLALHVNLRPWRRTGELVSAMRAAAIAGEDPARVAAAWAARFPGEIVLEDGVPRTDRGVGIFINGYAEFLARHGPGREGLR